MTSSETWDTGCPIHTETNVDKGEARHPGPVVLFFFSSTSASPPFLLLLQGFSMYSVWKITAFIQRSLSQMSPLE